MNKVRYIGILATLLVIGVHLFFTVVVKEEKCPLVGDFYGEVTEISSPEGQQELGFYDHGRWFVFAFNLARGRNPRYEAIVKASKMGGIAIRRGPPCGCSDDWSKRGLYGLYIEEGKRQFLERVLACPQCQPV